MYIFEDRNKNILNIKESLSLTELEDLGVEIGFNADHSVYVKLNGEDISSSISPELKEWVETQLNTKVDKITNTSANPRIYGVTEEGEQTVYFATQTPNANTIPLRDASGRFQVTDGIAPKQVVNKSQLDSKLDSTGGTITGDLAVQGNLTVAGTTKSEKNKSLVVEDNVIVTNANKVDLQVLLSGLAINKSEATTYGIMYDPADDTVKFGQGTLDKDNRFTFNEGEGSPLAIRDNASTFTNAHLVKWDSTSNKFVDAGIAAEKVALLDEQNTFTTPNTFTQEIQLDKGLASDDAISITNSVLKVMNNSDNGDGTQKDYVAQYDADKISLEEDGVINVLTFPRKTGTFATLEDVNGSALNLKHSEITNVDTSSSKEDTWKITDDDASVSIYHSNTVSETGLSVSKNYVGIQAREKTDEIDTAAILSFSADSISIGVSDNIDNKSGTITISKTGVEIDGAHVASIGDVAGKVDKFAESTVNEVYARTTEGIDSGIPFSYTAEGSTIARRSASGTLAVEDPTQEKDAANKKFVETKCANIPIGVQISDIAGSTSGILTDPDFAALQSNANNYILKDGKKFERSSERSTADSLSYVCNGYLNNRQFQEVIEITVSAKSWVLNSDNLLTDKTFANGKVGGVSIKSDFADGLEISQVNGNLSIYGALDADITARNSKRPITTVNLNKAVLAALTDSSKVLPNEDQISQFKAAWGFTESQYDLSFRVIELTPAEATNGTLSESDYNDLIGDPSIQLKLNNEYYRLSDDEHTTGIRSYTHTGWNGSNDQTKSINITLATKAWTLAVGEHNYYMHHIKLTVDTDKAIYYDFPSTSKTECTAATLPVQPDTATTTFAMIYSGRYASICGQIYRSGEDLKAILHGIYATSDTAFAYLSLNGVAATFDSDTVTIIN